MLDEKDDSLRDRLKSYQEEPDEDFWNRIRGELPGGSVKEQLSSYEEDPDAIVWSSIQQTIQTSHKLSLFSRASNVITALTLLGILLFQYSINGSSDRQDTINEEVIKQLTAASDTVHKPLIAKSKSDSTLIAKAPTSPKTKSKISSIDDVETARLSSNVEEDTKEGNILSREKKAGAAIGGKTALTEGTIAQSIESDIFNSNVNSTINKNDTSDLTNLNGHKTTVGLLLDSSVTRIKTAGQPISSADSFKKDSVILLIKDPVVMLIDSGASKSEKKEKKSSGGSGLYLLIMPTFGYQQLDPVKSDNIIVESMQKISAFSTSRLGIRAEVGWEKEISKRLVLNVGLLYFQRKQTISYGYTDPLRSELKASDSIPFLFVTNPNHLNGTFEYELKNIGIHTGLSYELKADRIVHRLGLGIEVQKGFSKSDLELPAANSLYLFGNIYYRASYRISKRIDLIFQPTFNYSFKVSEQLGAPFYVKPYGLGLSVGASFKLGTR